MTGLDVPNGVEVPKGVGLALLVPKEVVFALVLPLVNEKEKALKSDVFIKLVSFVIIVVKVIAGFKLELNAGAVGVLVVEEDDEPMDNPPNVNEFEKNLFIEEIS